MDEQIKLLEVVYNSARMRLAIANDHDKCTAAAEQLHEYLKIQIEQPKKEKEPDA